jgi:hypothetical protein
MLPGILQTKSGCMQHAFFLQAMAFEMIRVNVLQCLSCNCYSIQIKIPRSFGGFLHSTKKYFKLLLSFWKVSFSGCWLCFYESHLF